ncbi:MBOAT family O-acyltransferase, partial [Desulfobacterales bacterium HSG16]|nr:MBOAT family O-acyltransferase [Desulfobacterales bacterium HSG16]
GLTIFFLGLSKKVILADGAACYATPVFTAAENGDILTFFEAWIGTFAYTFQIYFDFSGYSDMAIGIARMFGIRLPLNFNSPYKSVNIIEFWHRWHITLSRFLREYIYIPLGGNRSGTTRRFLNLIITMLLGGLWHGANWTFVIWGALHGLYLIVNNVWREAYQSFGLQFKKNVWWTQRLSQIITFLLVAVAWVFFRSDSFSGAINILNSLAGMNGFDFRKVEFFRGVKVLLVLFIISWYAPNTQMFMSRYKPAFDSSQNKFRNDKQNRLKWSPSLLWAVLLSLISTYSILQLFSTSEFLYFDF